MSIGLESFVPPGARIKVVGVGGGGGNAVNTMIRSNIEGVEFVVANTDIQSLRLSLAPHKVQIGKELTRGLGAGADPDVGREAALEDRQEIQELLAGSDMVFITAGMGGGTGTGAAAVVAQIAREMGALTVAVVTKPFTFEGKRRKKHADLGVSRLRESVDTLITIPNQRLLQVAHPGLSMVDAFKMADAVLVNAVRGINDIINIPGIINVDFADVKTIMSCMGQALMGIGSARGENRATEAARIAVSSPLLEDIDIEGATGILINITAGSDLTLMEVNEACSIIQEAAHEDANIIFGSVIDESLGDQINVTVIATGFPIDTSEEAEARIASKPVSAQVARAAATVATAAATAAVTAPTVAVSSAATVAAAAVSTPASIEQPVETAVATSAPVTAQAEAEEQLATEAAPLAGAFAGSFAPSLDEARQLADWTFEKSDLDNGLALEEFPSLAHPFMAAPFETTEAAAELPQAPVETSAYDQGCESEEPVKLEGASFISDPQDDFAAIEFTVSQNNDVKLAGASAAGPQASLEGEANLTEAPFTLPDTSALASFFEDEQSFVTSDIDRKIDEALEMAQRLKAPSASDASKPGESDNLDVPAFLRQGMRDIPLG